MIEIHCVNSLNKQYIYNIYIYIGFEDRVSLSVVELRNTPVSSYQKFELRVPNKNNFKRILKLF